MHKEEHIDRLQKHIETLEVDKERLSSDHISALSATTSRSSRSPATASSSTYCSPYNGTLNVPIHQSNIQSPYKKAHRNSTPNGLVAPGSAAGGGLNVPTHRSSIRSLPAAASSSTYCSPYSAFNALIHQRSTHGPHEAVPGPFGDMPIQGNPLNPFDASRGGSYGSNPFRAGPLGGLSVLTPQNNIQIQSQAPGPAGGLNIQFHQNIAPNAPAASFSTSSSPYNAPDVPIRQISIQNHAAAALGLTGVSNLQIHQTLLQMPHHRSLYACIVF
jgi:hypothetical protein